MQVGSSQDGVKLGWCSRGVGFLGAWQIVSGRFVVKEQFLQAPCFATRMFPSGYRNSDIPM